MLSRLAPAKSHCIFCREEMIEELGGDELLDLGASDEFFFENSTFFLQAATSRDRFFARIASVRMNRFLNL